MPTMSSAETAFCRSRLWSRYASQRVLPWALADVPIDGHVVELGAGTGAMAAAMLQRLPSITYTATDLDPRMVEDLRRRLGRFDGRAEALVADAGDLPATFDDRFDAACSFLMLHHTRDVAGVLASAARCLHPGGWLVGYDLSNTALARAVHVIDRSPFAFSDADQLRHLLTRPAWSDVTVQLSAAGHVFHFRARRADTTAQRRTTS